MKMPTAASVAVLKYSYQGRLTEVEGLSTVDLLVKLACFAIKKKIFSVQKAANLN